MDGRSVVAAVCLVAASIPAPAADPAAKLVHDDPVECFAFAPAKEGRALLATAADKSVFLWDYTTGKQAGDPRPTKRGKAFDLAFSPDGKTLAVGCEDDILLWDVSDPAKVKDVLAAALPKGKSAAVHLTFSADGQKLYTAPFSCGVILEWDLKRDKLREVWKTDGDVFGLCWSGASEELLVVGYPPDGRCTLTPIDAAGEVGRSRAVTDKFAFARGSWAGVYDNKRSSPHLPCLTGFSPVGDKGDARLLVCALDLNGGDEAGLFVVPCTKGTPGDDPMHIPLPRGKPQTLLYSGCISADGTRVAAASMTAPDGAFGVILYDTTGKKAKEVSRFSPNDGKPFDRLAFSPDQKVLATSSALSRVVKVWDVGAVSKGGDK